MHIQNLGYKHTYATNLRWWSDIFCMYWITGEILSGLYSNAVALVLVHVYSVTTPSSGTNQGYPDPNLAVVTGRPHSLLGYLPWHTRLTEIMWGKDLMYYPYVLYAVVWSTLIVSLGVHVQECYSSVCLSVKSHLTSGASICPKILWKYCHVLSRQQRLKKLWGYLCNRSVTESSTHSTEGHRATYSQPFSAESACAL